MATLGLRHAVLYVADPRASARFYEQALGLVAEVESDNAVFMSSPNSVTDHDLGLFRAQPDQPSGIPLDLDADMARWGADRPGRGMS